MKGFIHLKIFSIIWLFYISFVIGECPCELENEIVTCYTPFIVDMPSDFKNKCPEIFANAGDIKGLDIQDQKMTEIKTKAFIDFPNVVVIALSFNDIETIHVGAFDGLDLLTHVSLDNNNISQVPDGTFDNLVSLTRLDLSNNPIQNMTMRYLKMFLIYVKITYHMINHSECLCIVMF